ncbi:MAG: class I SAM-dependent methyltransferase [bacterium]
MKKHTIHYHFPDHLNAMIEGIKRRLETSQGQLSGKLLITLNDEGLSIQLPDEKLRPLTIDFSNKDILRRYQKGWRHEALARAIGIKAGKYPSVLDCTAGLGQDSFLLAAYGCEVEMIEQSCLLNILLEDALNRATKHPKLHKAAARLTLHTDNSITFLTNTKKTYDVIYLDPMFPKANKSAASGRNMQYLQKILPEHHFEQDDQLFQVAREQTTSRIVVKRPKKASHLNNTKPDQILSGGSCRFDIYLPWSRRPEASPE